MENSLTCFFSSCLTLIQILGVTVLLPSLKLFILVALPNQTPSRILISLDWLFSIGRK